MAIKKRCVRIAGTFALATALSLEALALPPNNKSASMPLNQAFSTSVSRNTDKGVYFEPYNNLPAAWQKIIDGSANIKGYEGYSGEALYNKLDEKKRAGLLNILAKAGATVLPDQSTVLGHLQEIHVLHQDRLFAVIDAELETILSSKENTVLTRLPGYKSMLHQGAAKGYEKVNSYKSQDKQGVLDLTTSRQGDSWKVELDIDEKQGMSHLLQEVVPNIAFRKRTNPYKIQLLLIQQNIETYYRQKKAQTPKMPAIGF